MLNLGGPARLNGINHRVKMPLRHHQSLVWGENAVAQTSGTTACGPGLQLGTNVVDEAEQKLGLLIDGMYL